MLTDVAKISVLYLSEEVHGLTGNRLRIKVQLWHFLIMWPWTTHKYHLSIFYKMGLQYLLLLNSIMSLTFNFVFIL